VVGGGMAGLAAARTLAGAGFQVVLFERETRLGGRVVSLDLGPGVVDAGASHIWTFYGRTIWWLERCGLLPSLRDAPGQGSLPLRARDLPGVARAALDVARWWPRLRFERPELAARLDRGTIASYAGRHLRPEFVDHALRPAFEWSAFCSLEELSQVLLLQAGRLYLRARPLVLEGGVGRLPQAMAEGVEVRLGAAGEVRRIRGSAQGVGNWWRRSGR